MTVSPHADRTYVVTGAASGIGAATADYLRAQGARVIACDLRCGDLTADLADPEGRAALAQGVVRLSGGRIDGLVANAGGGPAETMLALNFFGAVATLESLRSLLAASDAPRAVVVTSISSLGPTDEALVEACLALDEGAAIAAGQAAMAAGKTAIDLYGSAKHALTRWVRRAAPTTDWAGAGIALNVVAPGVIDTPAAAFILSSPEFRADLAGRTPLRGAFPGAPGQMAATLAWLVSAENALITGQVLFADAGFECRARGERSW